MDAWLICLLSSLYATLLLLVHKDPILVTIWAIGVPVLALLLRRLKPRSEDTPRSESAKAKQRGRPT